jgi:two-component system response regulator VicR
MATSKKILIVEDDRDILNILNDIFTAEGYEVILSATGEATERLTEIKPDIILLDIRLEGSRRNGAAICASLKSDWETCALPVVLISAEANLQEISNDCGAGGFIRKPFDLDDLCYKIKVLIK